MISADDQQPDGEGMAGRLLLVADAVVPAAVHQACAELAARLADQAGLPVTVSTIITVAAKTHHYWSAHVATAGD